MAEQSVADRDLEQRLESLGAAVRAQQAGAEMPRALREAGGHATQRGVEVAGRIGPRSGAGESGLRRALWPALAAAACMGMLLWLSWPVRLPAGGANPGGSGGNSSPLAGSGSPTPPVRPAAGAVVTIAQAAAMLRADRGDLQLDGLDGLDGSASGTSARPVGKRTADSSGGPAVSATPRSAERPLRVVDTLGVRAGKWAE
ncbi:MAG: hypothetical protein LW650_05080 [Planctomycetaceae bacterium]|nr:hypothetical protein [Planctomycetaceae bacterium]